MDAYSVVTLPQAETEIAEYAAYIAQDSPSAALRWVEELERAISELAEMPTSHAMISERGRFRREYRQLRHYSHRIVFFVDEARRAVVVARVYHGARNQLRSRDLPA